MGNTSYKGKNGKTLTVHPHVRGEHLGLVAGYVLSESEPKWGQTRSDGQRENADLIAICRPIMRLIIKAHLVDDEGCTERTELASIERALTTDPLGMSLAEGKALIAAAQQHLVNRPVRRNCLRARPL